MIKLKIEVSEEEVIELTMDEAKKLYQELGEIFKQQELLPFIPTQPYIDYPQYPTYYQQYTTPQPAPFTSPTYPIITCSSDDL